MDGKYRCKACGQTHDEKKDSRKHFNRVHGPGSEKYLADEHVRQREARRKKKEEKEKEKKDP